MALPSEYWVEAELSECREHGGHCYMELVEKDERSNTPIARASAKCWRQTWMMVKPHFERTTGQPLRAGMKVLLRVYAQFHEAYGFSWIVSDIDPTYTLGDMARRRQEIIRQLKAEGIFDMQRELRLPLFCQRIAVISAPTAAGYGDFCRQLEDNEYGFRFDVTLFPAVMQGEQVEQSIIAALN
jgi:exodeoxyribonuclease VII large subunit